MALTYGFCLDADETTYTSEDFAEAFHAVFGNGVCQYGSQFALSDINNFTFTLGTGYAICRGRWLESDEPVSLTLQPAGNYDSRYDAVAVRVDYLTKKTTLEILTDVDPEAPPRNDKGYCIYLYLIYVGRGETVLEQSNFLDARGNTALCGYITPLSEISGDVEYIYNFLKSGIDQEVARIIGLSNEQVKKAEDAIAELDKQISAVRGTAIGDTLVSLGHPAPANEWLLCDGSPVPDGYPALSAILGGTLPLLTARDTRYKFWIYAGTPAR